MNGHSLLSDEPQKLLEAESELPIGSFVQNQPQDCIVQSHKIFLLTSLQIHKSQNYKIRVYSD